MTSTSSSSELHTRLHAVHRRDLSLHTALGLLALLIWLIGGFLIEFSVDWLVHLPQVVRAGLMVVLIAAPLYRAWRGGWRNMRAMNPVYYALRVESHYKNFESLLVTGVHLRSGDIPAEATGFAEHTIAQADQAARTVHAGDVVSFRAVKRPLVMVLMVTAVLAAIAGLTPHVLATGVARILTPWRAVEYPTRTQIELTNKQIVIREGDPLAIGAHLTGVVPAHAELAIRTGAGEPLIRTLEVDNGRCVYDMAAVYRGFDFALIAGDARTNWQTVQVIKAPKVVHAVVRVIYPDYTHKPAREGQSMTLTVPEGAVIQWRLTLDRPVSKAAFRLDNTTPVDVKVSEDGLTVEHQIPADASNSYAFVWVDKAHDFQFETARYYLQVTPDQPPRLELASPGGNLYATLHRDLTLAYRAEDDHGFARMQLSYSLNHLAEQTADLPLPTNEQATQHYSWNYHQALPDLAEGDTVTLSLQGADGYPPPQGPHQMRSENRRIMFVSQQDYLAKMHEQARRMLARLLSIYRQERAAYEVTRQLDASQPTFEQTCFLESSRQEIIADQLTTLSKNLLELADDLAANHLKDSPDYVRLTTLAGHIGAIVDGQINSAGELLGRLGAGADRDAKSITTAAEAINAAARDMANRVIDLGVDQATEVLASELHIIGRLQGELLGRALDHPVGGDELAAQQQAIESWLTQLLAKLGAFNDYSRAPLFVLRLTRMVTNLQQAQLDHAMRQAGDLLRSGHTAEATRIASDIAAQLLAAEYKLRIGAERETLMAGRAVFATALAALNEPGDNQPGELDAALGKLHRLVFTEIPAPPVGLLSMEPVDVPQVRAMLADVQADFQQCVEAGKNNAPDRQHIREKTKRTLGQLDQALAARLQQIGKGTLVAGRAGGAMERATLIREIHTNQLRLAEKTEDADHDHKSGAYLAPSQQHLADQLTRLNQRLQSPDQPAGTDDRVTQPVRDPLDQASDAMLKAVSALQADKLTEAGEWQDRILDALEKAIDYSNDEVAASLNLANLVMISEDYKVPTELTGYAVEQQQDLIEATPSSTPSDRGRLIAVQNNLAKSVHDLMGLLSGTQTPYELLNVAGHAESAMALSAQKLTDGDPAAAVKAQQQGAASASDLQHQFDMTQRRYAYFVVVMDFLQQERADGVLLLSQATDLRKRIESDPTAAPAAQIAALQRLKQDADRFSVQMLAATGKDLYAGAQAPLADALDALQAGRREDCLAAIKKAHSALDAGVWNVSNLMDHVGYIPSIDVTEAPTEFGVMMNMVDLLLTQKTLAASLYRDNPTQLAGSADDLRDLQEAAKKLLAATSQNPLIQSSLDQIGKAMQQAAKGANRDAFDSLCASEANLRYCFLNYAVDYVELPLGGGGRPRKKGHSKDVSTFKLTMDMKLAFEKHYSGDPGSEEKTGRSEWEVLGRRDRAALNENFIRELPLEYRDFLKDYYERLSQ